ncbi:TonB-dependent receptor [Paludibacter sp. 221]|uniref:TonB-dependent receptor n=1 Tax=Paludibacter sp. 221 TaxID=2302939 RepID=UPI0013D71CC5|nr:TonB-dependent receptor [Paludibacter sp. 221]NDV47579.1 TonB-dependent receptor [Paludibacter sp. 221]
MKKILYLTILLLISTLSVSAQVRGLVMDTGGEPLIGVNVYWEGTTVGVATDAAGQFSLPRLNATNRLVFSSVSFNNDTVVVSAPYDFLNVVLNEVIELSEVSVIQKKPGVLKARTSVFQTEKITGDELCKAACCNLSESFETNPSVDVAYSDAATGAKQIRLLGLSGAYVQMLTENIPSLRGISSAYGLGFIPGPWMESIQVSKGTSSVINGYEAITGQINVEYKKPQTSEIVAANVFASDAGRVEANANASVLLNDKLSTGVLLHFSDELRDNDHNGDDFLDMPKIRQMNAINRWYYTNGNYTSQVFLRGLSEKRTGGQIEGPYKIGIETQRYEFFTKNGYVFNHAKGTSLGFILSGSWHEQDAKYGNKAYDGVQGNIYANLIFQTNFTDAHKLSAGASFNMDDYNEKLVIPNVSYDPIKKREYVPGAFAEYTFNWDDKFIALAGLRGDYNSFYNRFLITPRLHLKYNVSDYVHLRASVGKGYRSPNVWAENNFLLASNRQVSYEENLKMEEAWNYGLSVQTYIPMFGRELSLSGEWYYTDFAQQVVTDMDADAHAVSFYNLNGGRSYASNLQFEANMEIVRGLTATLAHRMTDVKSTYRDGSLREKPLTNRYKSLFTASYQTPLKKWQFDFTTQLNGGGRLPDADADNPLWEKEFNPYVVLNAQITKYFKTWSVYLGSENLTGFVQNNPIVDVANPFGSDFDATVIWGPTHGRKIYVGFRWALDRE